MTTRQNGYVKEFNVTFNASNLFLNKNGKAQPYWTRLLGFNLDPLHLFIKCDPNWTSVVSTPYKDRTSVNCFTSR